MNKLIFLAVAIFTSYSSMAQNEFAFALNDEIEKESKKNILFSPTSIKTAFAMAYEGANGISQEEFEELFGFEEDNSVFFKEMKQLKKSAEISNSLWIQEDFPILPAFIEKMKVEFAAPPQYTDFLHDPKGSAEKINDWIEESTKGMIKKMLTPSDVKSLKMALVNAIYFKQDWKYTFDKKMTREKSFTNFSGSESKIDMMHSRTHFRAVDGANEKMIELPYADDKTSMVILMPDNMKRYNLTEKVYTDLFAKMYHQKVDLDLPKFTFETPTFELIPFLKELGMEHPFTDTADFSGMRKQKDLKIGTVLHKAKIIVNEEGTEAAAATVIGMAVTTSAPSFPPPVMEMHVDKPFYYFIKDNATGAILFMGRMNEL